MFVLWGLVHWFLFRGDTFDNCVSYYPWNFKWISDSTICDMTARLILWCTRVWMMASEGTCEAPLMNTMLRAGGMKKFISTGALQSTDLESPTLSLRSDPPNKSDFHLSFDSDSTSISSSTDFLDSIHKIFALDTQSLNDVSPCSDSPRRLNFGKKRMAPQPPVRQRQSSEPGDGEDHEIVRCLSKSRSEERLDSISLDKKLRSKSSCPDPVPAQRPNSVGPRFSSKKIKLKAAFRIATLQSPNSKRKSSTKKKSKRNDESSDTRTGRAKKSMAMEQMDYSVYMYGFGLVPEELLGQDTEFEVCGICPAFTYLHIRKWDSGIFCCGVVYLHFIVSSCGMLHLSIILWRVWHQFLLALVSKWYTQNSRNSYTLAVLHFNLVGGDPVDLSVFFQWCLKTWYLWELLCSFCTHNESPHVLFVYGHKELFSEMTYTLSYLIYFEFFSVSRILTFDTSDIY